MLGNHHPKLKPIEKTKVVVTPISWFRVVFIQCFHDKVGDACIPQTQNQVSQQLTQEPIWIHKLQTHPVLHNLVLLLLPRYFFHKVQTSMGFPVGQPQCSVALPARARNTRQWKQWSPSSTSICSWERPWAMADGTDGTSSRYRNRKSVHMGSMG